ncbi:hypothetical protein F0L68_27115 [Solihabitans fulvus]|uniref:LigA protein n=1 Tax=Solihabitans fulvus TaxID=1892852 RepID=A0A5B2WYY0_9PSEU|nr:hypothetical protein [Solihabitans fulvus]KAA2256114.1 hypothetical protein F0L68_27115 [Solihabitans fulvus]
MTVSAPPSSATARPDRVRPGALRLVACYATIASTIPYLVLKTAWLFGDPIGFVDRSLVDNPVLIGGNAATAAMDVVAALLALTLTYRWGRRASVWLVGFPMWVGAGLLTPIALAMPIAAVHAAATGVQLVTADNLVRPWVYGLVYTGFTAETLTLLVAFVLYARHRWGTLLRARVDELPPGTTHAAQRVLTAVAAALAGIAFVVHLLWACGLPVGQPEEVGVDQGFATHVLDGAYGLTALACGLGLVLLVYRPLGRLPYWVPIALTWVGSGGLFGWGVWSLLPVLAGSALTGTTVGNWGLIGVLGLVRVLAGALGAGIGVILLAERAAAPHASRGV